MTGPPVLPILIGTKRVALSNETLMTVPVIKEDENCGANPSPPLAGNESLTQCFQHVESTFSDEIEQFIALLKRFGPERILFGTNWPWFEHEPEIARIA